MTHFSPDETRRAGSLARAKTAVLSLYWLIFAAWFGGLFTLGAIVAPIIFRRIPAPWAADGMTEVFRRFDRFALLFAVLLLVLEGIQFFFFAPALPTETFDKKEGDSLARQGRRRAIAPRELFRLLFLSCAALARAVMALHFSPMIASLHEMGAVRGSGDLGRALEVGHRWAERLAKVEVFFLFLVAVLLVAREARNSHVGRKITVNE